MHRRWSNVAISGKMARLTRAAQQHPATGSSIAAAAAELATHVLEGQIVNRLIYGLIVAASLLATAAMAQQGPNTLGKIKAAKAINVAYSPESLPFSFAEPGKEPQGYSIDLCKRVIAQIGRAVGEPNLKVNWLAGSTPERLQMVATGKADLECANTTQTLGRLANVDFSGLIFIDAGGFIVRTDSKIDKLTDMGGKKVAVLKGTTTEARLKAALQRRLVNATVVEVDTGDQGLAMVEAGSVDAYAGDKIKIVGLALKAKNPAKLAMLNEELSYEPYAMALPRGDSALRLEVNRALTQVYVGGEIETIFGQWLGTLGRPSGLLAAMYLLYSIPD
jgi:glutamate/aspartate transport system substrate-binding protein